jgi:serine protease DegS
VARLKPILTFLLQSIIVGLAAAFLVVLVRPQLLPAIDNDSAEIAGRHVSYADAVDIAAPSVANVYTRRLVSDGTENDQAVRFRVNTGVGSAVIFDEEGYLVTNYHVVFRAADIRLQLADGQLAIPKIIGVDEETDLALLKVDLGTLPAIPLGRSDQIRIGDVVLAIGNPYGLPKSESRTASPPSRILSRRMPQLMRAIQAARSSIPTGNWSASTRRYWHKTSVPKVSASRSLSISCAASSRKSSKTGA